MGMFDYIRCEKPLPDGWTPDELQTKDFDCEMVTHIISADGRLMLDRGYYESVPKHERPYPDAKRGRMRRVPKYEDANFHGLVHFYGLETVGTRAAEWHPRGREPIYKRHEYFAKFTDGRLVEITMNRADDDPPASPSPSGEKK